MSEDLGYYDTYYHMTQKEFSRTPSLLPDGNYGVKANDFTRKFVEFEPWEDETDCKWIIFDVEHGIKCNFRNVDYDVYKTCVDFVIIEK